MDVEWSESRHERSEQDDSPNSERWKGGYDDLDENSKDKSRESNKHRSREKSKSSRREEKDHRSRDRDRSKVSDISKDREKEPRDLVKDPIKDRRKDDKDDHEKDRTRDKVREKDNDRDKYRDREREREKERKDRGKEKEREKERELEKDTERGQDKDRGKEKRRDREKEGDKVKDRSRDKGKEKNKDREKGKENQGDRDREKGKDRIREKERDADQDKERSREKDKVSRKQQDDGHDRNKGKDDKVKTDIEESLNRDTLKHGTSSHQDRDDTRNLKHAVNDEDELGGSHRSATDLQDRIIKMKEERLKKNSDSTSDVLSWVTKSRKLEEKRNFEKERVLQLSKVFEEQDNVIQGEDDDEMAIQHTSHDLAGLKVLHGLDKVIKGGAVVLTLKDQSILANGDLNQEVDMLENVEIGEQKRRNEAYEAAKKKTGIYADKFNEEPGSEKKMLPQYDDPVADEGVTLDASGRFSGEAEKKLEELRRRINGVLPATQFEDLNTSGKISSDYFTSEEMLQFKKPKKKKSLRKKDKLDIDALEAEAVSAGLGVGDRGTRTDGKRRAVQEEQERAEAEKRSNAFQSAYAKADEASKALRMEQTVTVQGEEDNPVFGEDDEDLYKSLQRARKIALEAQAERKPSGPQVIALLASSNGKNLETDKENLVSEELQENKVVFTEMEEFVWGLQLDEEAHKPDAEDVFMEEDVVPITSDQGQKVKDGGWAEVKDTGKDEKMADLEEEEEVKPDSTIHETAIGKGLSGVLQLLKDRGTFKETVEWGGRNMDKKKSKLVGLEDSGGQKDIHTERTDEFGRILTPKEAFRLLSHKFHGKGPGKMKQEKRMQKYNNEMKVKQMKNADTPSSSVARMIEAQSKLQTPFLVLSGNVKPGQTSDPRNAFGTVEDFPGSLTPMLGDRKVEHFLGIKRSSNAGDMGPPKKPRK